MNLASGQLSQPLLIGSQTIENDIHARMWPSYKRLSLANGGDLSANFSFSAPDHVLEKWFENYLMAHFEESFGGVVTWVGYVHAMTLSYRGIVLSKSMDDLANKVAVWYKTGSGASKALSAFSSDTDSIAKYGTKELLETVEPYMALGTANSIASDILSETAWPRSQSEEVALGDVPVRGVLRVELRGYVHTLDWQHQNDATTSNANASAEVSDALSGADYVSGGTIETNTRQVTQEVVYQGGWQRIKALTKVKNGGLWLAGCYAGRTLDYYQADLDTIVYNMDMKDGRRIIMNADESVVHPAQVVPGKMGYFRDILVGRHEDATLLRDPRAIFIQRVEYSKNGLVLRGLDTTGVSRAIALQIAASQT